MSDDELTIEWSVPGGSTSKNKCSKRAMRCLELAQTCARDFDSSFAMHDANRECSMPQFHPDELRLYHDDDKESNDDDDDEEEVKPDRISGYFTEYRLREIVLLQNSSGKDKNASSPSSSDTARRRFASRSDDGYYAVKFLQHGIVEQDHAPNATTEMILEAKILMSLSQHPHIRKMYGVTSSGLKSLVQSSSSSVSSSSGRYGYFFITDRLSETLVERMDTWRSNMAAYKSPNSMTNNNTSNNRTMDVSSSSPTTSSSDITQRLEVALDIASALVFLHDRKLVFYMRPDKVGFDARHGGVKLFNFGQARQFGMQSHPRSVTQSDCMTTTLAYTAPEVFCNSAAHAGTDVYGFAVLLWEMVSLKRPFCHYTRAMHFEQVVRRHDRQALDVTPHPAGVWDADIAAMLTSCWHPTKRPTMKKVHSILETKLLYQESSNQIQDTARILKRQQSQEVVLQLMDEIQLSSPRKVVRQSSSDRVLALFSNDQGKLEIAQVESEMLQSQDSFCIDDLHDEINHAPMEQNTTNSSSNKRSSGRKAAAARDASRNNTSSARLEASLSSNESESSLQCSMDLEQVLRDVSSSLGDEKQATATNTGNPKRTSSRVSDKANSRRSSQKNPTKRRSRRHTSSKKHDSSTDISPVDETPSQDSRSSMNSSDNDELDVMGDDECADDLIASLIEQNNTRGEVGSPTSMVATYDISPNPKRAPLLDGGRGQLPTLESSPQKQNRTLLRGRNTIVSAIGVAIAASPKQSVSKSLQRLRRRSKSRSRTDTKNQSSSGDLSEFLSGDEGGPAKPSAQQPTSNDGTAIHAQTVVSQILARVPRSKSTSTPQIRIKPALAATAAAAAPRELPEIQLDDSQETSNPLNESNEGFEKKRSRRASLAEVKGTFDFYPDPVRRTASTEVIKQLQDVIEKTAPSLQRSNSAGAAPECPSSPTKAMAMMGKRMLGNIRRLGASGTPRNSYNWPPESPEPTPKPSIRRSSLVHEIVSQNKSFRVADGPKSGSLPNVDDE